MRRALRSSRARMLEFSKDVVNVPGHAEAAAPVEVVPLDGDASQFVTS